ncbi:MAG: cyclic nucleotide-binding domain-containing protein [Anaerolineae bacterium]|nr:cyclic nucleotide-binding domain-containing protein [Anaerolineae bacterium]
MTNKLAKYLKQLRLSRGSSRADPKLVKYLAKQPLFKNTPETVLAKITSQINIRTLEKGEVLLRQGDPGESLFLIRTGWVKLVTQGDKGEEVMLNQFGPGQIFGEMSLLDREPHSHTVIALRPTEIMAVTYDVILDILNEHPELAVSFLREMSSRVRFANAYIEESISWCRRLAEGDYGFVKEQISQSQSTIVDANFSNQARASAFLSVFFRMAQSIQQREENLKRQVEQLIIEIDEVKRQQKVQEVTETEFFGNLQATAQKLRRKRQAKVNRRRAQSNHG